jgi:cytochrome P450
VYDKLVNEIRGSFTNANEINRESVKRLDYQHAVIKEALRLFPPIPGNLRRMTRSNGCGITNQWFPPGVAVAIDVCAPFPFVVFKFVSVW